MLTNVKILSPVLQRRCGKTSLTLEPGINILMGPNGSGKSTLLNAIKSVRSDAVATSQVELSMSDARFPLPLFYHSSDVVVRTEGDQKGSNLSSLQSRSESHGQTLLRYLSCIENQPDPAVFIIDEPEVALSAERLVEFRDMLVTKVAEGMQFVIATHHILLYNMPEATLHIFGNDKNYAKTCINIIKKSLGKTPNQANQNTEQQ